MQPVAVTTSTSASDSPLHLSTHDLKRYLSDEPFLDWLDLHGVQWLQQQPKALLANIYKDSVTSIRLPLRLEQLATTQKLRAHQQAMHAALSDHALLAPTPALSRATDALYFAFHEWVLQQCYLQQQPAPPRINQSAFAGQPHVLDQQHTSAIILETPVLVWRKSAMASIRVSPTFLVSQPLAVRLFGKALAAARQPNNAAKRAKPNRLANATFARWVAVTLRGGSAKVNAKTLVSHTARTSRYDATCFQCAHEAVTQWLHGAGTGATGAAATTSSSSSPTIAGVLVFPNAEYGCRFYLAEPPSLVLHTDAHTQQLSTTTTFPWDNAIRWAAHVRTHGASWHPVTDRERIELCPPPTSDNVPDEFQPFVDWLRHERKDICRVYKVSLLHRAKAWAKGARTYEDLWTMQQTLKPLKLPALSTTIAWVNHSAYPDKQLVQPRKFTQNAHRELVRATRTTPYFIVDFETIRTEWIFMVATVHYDPVHKTRKVFTERMQSLTDDEQTKMLQRWVDQMRALLPAETALHELPIFHWSAAEPRFIQSLYTRKPQLATCAPELADTVRTGLQWVDLCDVFVREPIAIPGCFDFKLKHVVKALAAIGALPSTANLWGQDDGAIQDGRAAMEIAEQAYKGLQPAHVFEQLQTYNEADVLVLWDVLEGVLVGMV